MKEIVEYLKNKNIICKTLREILPKELGSRKKIEIYTGTNLTGYYCSVMLLEKKSRLLRREAGELMDLHEKLEAYRDTKILTRYIRIRAPLCSKARALFEENGWKVWHEIQ